MTLKTQTTVSPEMLAEMDADAITAAIAANRWTIYSFTPNSLRRACDLSYRLRDRLCAMLEFLYRRRREDGSYLVDSTTPFERPGYRRSLTDHELVGKLLQVVKDCFAGAIHETDPDESGFEAARARREARAAENKARLEALGIKTSPAPALQAAVAAAVEKAVDAASEAPDDVPPGDIVAEGEVVRLPELYAGQLHISNIVLGSRILSIGAQQKSRRYWTEMEPLVVEKVSGYSAETVKVMYQGQELRPDDVETWSAVLVAAQKVQMGTDVSISAGSLLRVMGREDGGAQYEALRKQVTRLQNAKMTLLTTNERLIKAIAQAMPTNRAAQSAVNTGELRLSIPLLGGSAEDTIDCKKDGLITLSVPKDVRALFGPGLHSFMSRDVYRKIKTPTAKRLYLLLSRHSRPMPLRLDELYEFLGSTTKQMRDFKTSIEAAYGVLHKAGVIRSVPTCKENKERRGFKTYAVEMIRPSEEVVVIDESENETA